MIKIGNKAPAFTLSNQKNEKISIKNYLGKKVILYFYPKDNTSGCTTEALEFKNHINDFTAKNSVIIGVSADSVDSHCKFAEKNELPFDLLSDEKKVVLEKYEVWKEKSMFGKEYMGIERTTFIIDELGKIQDIFPKVKVNGHFKELLEKL